MTPKDHKKLIRLLKVAHAIEIGAYQAYEGHWRSIMPISHPDRFVVKIIQVEELIHREAIFKMLNELGAKPSPALDSILWVVGRCVSATCYIAPKLATKLGARIMESFAVAQYFEIASVAREAGFPEMAAELREFAMTELEHEAFFRR